MSTTTAAGPTPVAGPDLSPTPVHVPKPDPSPTPVHVAERLYTLDEVLNLQDDGLYELIDGRLEEVNVAFPSNFVTGTIIQLLKNHCGLPPIAFIVGENGFACFPGKKNRMRRPDVSVILAERAAPDLFGKGFTSIRPDLAIEVISPNDLVVKLEEKLDDFRSVGIPLVWLVYPDLRRVRVLPLDGPTVTLGPDDELTGGAILPGFRCKVSDLFAGLPEPIDPAAAPE